ncbi:MAG TPA: hypothetical protein VGQ44_17125 [Gemmatimonadaceae bacterium]|jgi:hypothetical protein|nr:hypothetical protein [Gemmatimonadaceae bacterium]
MPATSEQVEVWRGIEAAARKQVQAELRREDAVPLAAGRLVAWVNCHYRRTDGLSVVHRVGEPLQGASLTLCGEIVPPAIRRVALTEGLVRSLGRCPNCEDVYARKGAAA